jgi:parallel beta helix pectate lyase-like protein
MKLRFSGLTLVLLFVTAPLLHAQAWTGILDPSRAIDWSNAGIPGGIPNRTTICATLNPGATSAQIDAAIAACPSGQVVFLAAGTYSISAGISFAGRSNVTLRGAGPTQTILQFTGGDPCNGLGGDVCLTGASASYVGSANVQPGGAHAASWSGGYAKASNQISLSGPGISGIAIGTVLILDQANDVADTRGVFICDIAITCHDSSQTGSSNGRTIAGIDYNQQQLVTVTAINGNTFTISPGLYANNWRTNQNPGAWWNQQLSASGLEDLTVDHSQSTTASSGVFIYDCDNCWISNIRSIDAKRNHVWLYQSSNAVIRDSYFYGTQNAASQSYGIETFITSDDLIENNIFDTVTNPVMYSSCSGCVVGYNYSLKNAYTVSQAWMMGAFASHDAGNMMNLFEGNDFDSLYCDNEHGTSDLSTYFRNQLTGTLPGKSLNTMPVTLMSYCRGFNIVGNVLGTIGYHKNYEASLQTSAANCDVSIYQLGWSGTECSSGSNPPNDAIVRSSLLRWGNYDVVAGSPQWNPAEVPTTASTFINANPIPSGHTLPDSFYKSSKPNWWGSVPWPAAGPDVSGGPGAGGFAYANPAQLCYGITAKDANGILLFDAKSCYGQQSSNAPAPPTNLGATVQD